MSYIGNPGLPQEMQDRILNVFQQALDLAEAGSHEEAILGCDFVLQMDPLFTPAQALMERVKAAEEPVEVEDLRIRLLDSPGEPAIDSASEAGQEEESEGEEEGLLLELLGAMEEALEERNFRTVLDLAAKSPDLVTTHPELAELTETAQGRHEAAPYVEKFLESARGALGIGDFEQAQSYLQKAEVLDATHPGIEVVRDLERQYREPVTTAPSEETVPEDLEELAELEQVEAAPAFDVVDEAGPEDHLEVGEESLELGGGEISFDDVSELRDLEVDDEDELAELDLGEDEELEEEPEAAVELEDPEVSGGDVGESESRGEDDGGSAQAFAGESDPRIVELLTEGQERYEAKDYQGAIDAWSRIFLIDIDHPEASRLIEEARRSKEEGEREIEELFQVGVEHLQADEIDEAKATFQTVLERQPGHLGAQEYLEQLEAGEAPSVAAVEPETDDGFYPRPDGIPDFEAAKPAGSLMPEEESEAAVPPSRSRKSFVYVGGAVLALVLMGGFFLMSSWDRFFPNAEDTVQAPAEPSPIERATKLHEEGKTAIAVAQLKRLPPTHADYEQAQVLIQEWESPQEDDQGPDPEEMARRAELLRRARSAFSSREYLRSVPLLEKADEIAALDQAEREMLREARIQVDPLLAHIRHLRESEYEEVLPKLWLLWDQDRENRDVAYLLTTSYYNLGVRHLQRGNPALAHEMFGEALSISQDDEDLHRLYLFAQTFKTRPHGRDLVYRIFVKYLPFRNI